MLLHSILSKLIAVFAISIILTITAIIQITQYSNKALRAESISRLYFAILAINKLYASGAGVEIDKYLQDIDFQEITDKRFMRELCTSNDKPIDHKTNFGLIQGIVYKDKYYLKLINQKNNSLKVYENTHNNNINDGLIKLLISLIIMMFFASLIYCYNLIQPLKGLTRHIRDLSNGKNSNFSYYKNDEIGLLTKEFNKATKKNNELVLARRFFLRAIMHELKTPIAKGMFAATMPESEKNKKILISVFKGMNALVNEFKQVEEILSKNHEVVLKEYSYSYLLEQSISALYLDNLQIIDVKMNEDRTIIVDGALFIILIKNLLDNAIKYSSNHKCIIEFQKDYINVKNIGEEKDFNTEEYFKPFARGNVEQSGFGLGLYLIKYICDTQGFELKYFYDDGYHNFRIIL